MSLSNIITTHFAQICIVFNIPYVEGQVRQHEFEDAVESQLNTFVSKTVAELQKPQKPEQHLPMLPLITISAAMHLLKSDYSELTLNLSRLLRTE